MKRLENRPPEGPQPVAARPPWLALAALAAALLPAPPPATAAEVLDNVVLRINDEILTLVEYRSLLADRQQAILAATDVDPATRREAMEDAPRRVARELYEELLLLSRAEQLAIEVKDAEVDESLRATQERMGILNDRDLAQALAASGLTLDQVRQRLRKNILVQRVVGREIQEGIEVDEEQLRRIYRERQAELEVPAAVRLQEIIVLAEAVPDREQRLELARQVVRDLEAGATLESISAEQSTAGQISQVIDLGWVERGDLAPELDAGVWDLAVGEHSEPLEAAGGTHVLQALERREAAVRPFEEVRQFLLARERERLMATEYGAYLTKLEGQSYIVMRLPPEAAAFTGFAGETEEPELPTAESGLE